MFSKFMINNNEKTKREDYYPKEPNGLSEMDEMINEKNQYEFRKEIESKVNHNYQEMIRLSSDFIRDNYASHKNGKFLSDIWEEETQLNIEDVEALYIYDINLYHQDAEIMISDIKLAQNVFSNIKVPQLQNYLFIRPDYNWDYEVTIYTKDKIYTARSYRDYDYHNIFTEAPRH